MIYRFLLPLIGGTALFAQAPPNLKDFLDLADPQIQALAQLQQQKVQILQPVVQQIAQAQQNLNQILAAPNPDPAAAGQLVIAIATLGHQAQQITDRFQQQAASVLAPVQRDKLPALALALGLHAAGVEAAALGLVYAP